MLPLRTRDSLHCELSTATCEGPAELPAVFGSDFGFFTTPSAREAVDCDLAFAIVRTLALGADKVYWIVRRH